MAFKDIIVLVTLFAFAVAVKLGSRHPPHYHGHYHHDAVPVNPEVSSANMLAAQSKSVQEEVVEIDEYNQEVLENEDDVTDDNVPMIGLRRLLIRKDIPTSCDALSLPRYSCYSCYSYLVCKPEGGKIKACKDPYAPYCNNGVCSQIPSESCSNL